MLNKLFEKSFYTIPKKFLKHEIFEYDIAKANISILKDNGILNQYDYDRLANCTREERHITIGKMQKDPTINKIINDGFLKARQRLFELNDIRDEEVISIKKDAVYVTRRLINTDFGDIHFTLRNVYTLFCKLDTLEIYYGVNDAGFTIDIKGISSKKKELHKKYIHTIGYILYHVVMGMKDIAMEEVTSFIRRYRKRECDICFYREFNANSMFKLTSGYYMSEQDKNLTHDLIDPAYNDYINNKLFSLVFDMCLAL